MYFLLLVFLFICVFYLNINSIVSYFVLKNVVYVKLVMLSLEMFLLLNVVNGFLFDFVYILGEKFFWLRIDLEV